MITKRRFIPLLCACAMAGMLFFLPIAATLSQTFEWRAVLPMKSCAGDSSIYSVHMASAQHCYAVGEDGAAHRSTDGGATWSPMNVGTPADLYGVAFSTPQRGLICGDRGTLLRTTDGGSSWSTVALQGFESRAMYSVAWLDSMTVVVCGGASAIAHGQFALPDGFILRSTDAGVTWSGVRADVTQFFWRMAAMPDAAAVRVTSYGPLSGGGILASVDRGATWQQEATQLPFLPHDIGCALAAPDTICFACGGNPTATDAAGGLVMKRNDGVWTLASPPPSGGFVWSVAGRMRMGAPSLPEVLASVGTQNGQIWQYLSDRSWRREIDAPSSCALYTLVDASQVEAGSSAMLAGGSGHGLFVGRSAPMDVQASASGKRDAFVLRNSPNPFHTATEITFSLPERGQATVLVRDLLGRAVAVLADSEQDAGAHDLRFDASGLPAGVYVCTLLSGGTERHVMMVLR